jgi:hypothetical protein
MTCLRNKKKLELYQLYFLAKARPHCLRTGEYCLTTLLARGATPANENGGFPDLYNKAADERRPTVVLENQNPV